MSCNFFRADLKEFFSLLSKVSRKRFVLSPEVAGRITINLDNIPWDQALNAVANLYNLEVTPTGEGFTIAPKRQ
jgi:type IV pilus assembly protein PilQ